MSDRSPEAALYLVGFGAWAFTWGLRTWMKKRLIENIPSAKVRSASKGLVELKGIARARKPMISPVSGADCSWWRFEVQELRSSGKNSRWVTIQQLACPEWLFLEDDTGRVLVDPDGSEMHIVSRHHPLDAALRQRMIGFLPPSGGSWFSRLGSGRQRVLESLIPEGSPLYVLGDLAPRTDALQGRRERLQALLRRVKTSSEAMKSADQDGDGNVSVEEWDVFRRRLEEEFLARERAQEEAVPADERHIVRGGAHFPFIISTRDEEELTRRWNWLCPIAVLGGSGMTGIGIWISMTAGHPLWLTALLIAGGWLIGMFTSKRGGLKWHWS